jgi:hypothetical protein
MMAMLIKLCARVQISKIDQAFRERVQGKFSGFRQRQGWRLLILLNEQQFGAGVAFIML